jgi:hypothetical protein
MHRGGGDAEVAVEDVSVLRELLGLAVEDEAAGRDHVHVVGDGQRQRQMLLDEKDRVAALLQAADDLADLLHETRRQTLRGRARP